MDKYIDKNLDCCNVCGMGGKLVYYFMNIYIMLLFVIFIFFNLDLL